MMILRRLALAALLALGLSPALAQAPGPVPALPDSPRLTSYSITASTCGCAVNFALYGNAGVGDYYDWVEVWLNGVRVNYNDATYGWTITSPSGALTSIAQPVADAVLNFNSVQTGAVQIVGAYRPARLSQFSENAGVSARNLNVAFTSLVATLREVWDKINDVTGRGLFFAPGNAAGPMPAPSACANGWLGFDSTGLNPVCSAAGGPYASIAGNSILGNASSSAAPVAVLPMGTGAITALEANVGNAGSVVVNGGAGGAPSSINLAHAANLPNSALQVGAAAANLGFTPLGPSALPSATTSQLYGGTGAAGAAADVTIGSGLSLSGGTLSASGSATLPVATTAQIYGGTGTAGTAQIFPLGTNVSPALQIAVGSAGSILINGATPLSVGSSLYPNITNAVTTTATSTSGSANITVTSATGLQVGMGVYASFIPSECSTGIAAFRNPYITAISGTTVTVSCPASATSATPAGVQFGQNRYDPTSSVLANDVGTQTLKVGSTSQGNTAAWLNQIVTGEDYRLTSAAQIVTPPGGAYALTVGARTSDATGGSYALPLNLFYYADTWGNSQRIGWAEYIQSNLSAATAGGLHLQAEQSIDSLWTTVAEDPYTWNQPSSTIGRRYDCGTGQTSAPLANNCTAAIELTNNGASFEDGIVIMNGSIDNGGGSRVGVGIAMPTMVALDFHSASGVFSAEEYSPSPGVLDFLTASGGSINFGIGSGPVVGLNATTLYPVNDNAYFLGSSASKYQGVYTYGVVGTTAGGNAPTGDVGEYQTNTTTATAMTTSTVANCTSVSLTAGDWDVSGTANFAAGSGAAVTYIMSGINTASATLGALGTFQQLTNLGTANVDYLSAPTTRVNVSATTTVYLVGESVFSGGTMTCNGFIRARRVR